MRTLVIAGVALVLVAAAATGGWFWYDAQQRRVAAAYAEVMTRVYAAQGPQASADARARAQRDLEQILTQYPSAASVAEAAFELGNLRYAAQQWAPARGAWEIALARGGGPSLRALARTSIGYAWEAERNWAKAADAFQGVARELGPKDFLYVEVLLALARAQELGGKPGEAIATLQRVAKDAPSSPRSDEARQGLLRMGVKAEK